MRYKILRYKIMCYKIMRYKIMRYKIMRYKIMRYKITRYKITRYKIMHDKSLYSNCRIVIGYSICYFSYFCVEMDKLPDYTTSTQRGRQKLIFFKGCITSSTKTARTEHEEPPAPHARIYYLHKRLFGKITVHAYIPALPMH